MKVISNDLVVRPGTSTETSRVFWGKKQKQNVNWIPSVNFICIALTIDFDPKAIGNRDDDTGRNSKKDPILFGVSAIMNLYTVQE